MVVEALVVGTVAGGALVVVVAAGIAATMAGSSLQTDGVALVL